MSKNVLVIEKEFDISRQIARALESEGYFVFTASTAEAGLVMARRVKPSLIFLDLSVKDAGGTEFIGRLRAVDFLHSVPILLLTAKEKEYEPRYRDLYGIVNFVKIPLNDAEVVAKSKATLENVPAELPAGGAPPLGEEPASKEGESTKFSPEAHRAETAAGLAGDGYAPAYPEEDAYPENSADEDSFIGEGALHIGEADEGEDETLSAGPGSPGEGETRDEDMNDAAMLDDKAWQSDMASEGPASMPETQSMPEPPPAPGPLSHYVPGPDPGAKSKDPIEAEFEAAVSEAQEEMKRQEHLFGDEYPPAEDKTGTEESDGSEAGQKEGHPEGFHYSPQKSGKSSPRKSLILVLSIVLLGAAASFVFFMYLQPRLGKMKGGAPAAAITEDQPVVIEQNTPASAPASNVQAKAGNVKAKAGASNVKAKAGANISSGHKVPAGASSLAAAETGKTAPAKGGKDRKIESGKSPGFWALLDKEEKEEAGQQKKQDAGKSKIISKTEGKNLAGHFYSLQTGAFSSEANAGRLAAKLKTERFNAFVEKTVKNGKLVYKVLVGRYGKPADTNDDYERLKKAGITAFRYSE